MNDSFVREIVQHVQGYNVAEGDERRVYTLAQLETAIRLATQRTASSSFPIKQLEWEEGLPSSETQIANTGIGVIYTVWEINGVGVWTDAGLPGRIVKGGVDEAKIAAQYDFCKTLRG